MQKKVLMNVETVYTANAFELNNEAFVGAGSETTPEVYFYELDGGKKELVADCPGGVMSFVPVPGKDNDFYSIMGLFPPFVGAEAGVFRHIKSEEAWKTERVMHLPFAHRCDIINQDGKNYLFAASCSKFKENPLDWSKQGEVYLISLDQDGNPGEPLKIMDLGRNHGMIKKIQDGKETIFVSGEQGVFYFDNISPEGCDIHQIYDKEVSEFGLIDLDGDGQDELVAIEPFHGNALNFYKKVGDSWELKYTDALEFGHGLGCGQFNGEAIVTVGNRRGPLTLCKYSAQNLDEGKVLKEELEQEAGPTQTQVFTSKGTDYILSANQLKKEVAIYWK